MPATSDYQKLIDNGRFMWDSQEQRWDQVIPRMVPLAHYGQGLEALSIAVGHVMLGDVAEGRAWFRHAAEQFLRGLHIQDDNVAPEKRVQECAALSGDRELWLRAAQALPEWQIKRTPAEYPYAMFLKYARLGHQEAATRYAGLAAAQNPATMKKLGGYATLGAACQALDRRDPLAFQSALQKLLDEHRLKAAHGWRKLPIGYICLPGATLLLLARDFGLPVAVESAYIPPALLS